jgi:hypothetical protein
VGLKQSEDLGKLCCRVNMVEMLCTHVWKWKNKICWNYSRNGGKRIKEDNGGGELNYDILTWVSVKIYSKTTIIKEIKKKNQEKINQIYITTCRSLNWTIGEESQFYRNDIIVLNKNNKLYNVSVLIRYLKAHQTDTTKKRNSFIIMGKWKSTSFAWVSNI